MSPLLIVLIGIAVVLTVRSIRRNVVDNHSVKHHHRALDTLGEISQHQDRVTPPAGQPKVDPSAHPHVRVVRASESTTGRFDHAVRRAVAPPPIVPPPTWPAVANHQASEDRPQLVFDDTGAARAATPAPSLPPPALPTPIPAHAPVPPQPAAAAVVGSLSSSTPAFRPGRPPRRRPLSDYRASRWVLAGVGVVSILIAIVGVLVASQGPTRPTRTQAKAASAANKSAQPATTPTTSVGPGGVSAVLIGSSSDGAQYGLPGTAQLELLATERCWVQIRTGSNSGAVVFSGMMQPGDRQPLPPGTPVWLRLGNPPGISIVVNGQPLHLDAVPTGPQPFNLTFQPSA
jgi:hypothetical protein